MLDLDNFDWEVGEIDIDITSSLNIGDEVMEIEVSPNGKILAVITKNEDTFTLTSIGKSIEKFVFERIENLCFVGNYTLCALVLENGKWTVFENGSLWEDRFDFVWKLNCFSNNHGKNVIAVAAKNDMNYFAIKNKISWNRKFQDMTFLTLSPNGENVAAVVQTDRVKAGNVNDFQRGIYSVAINGNVWKSKFLNVWNLVFGEKSNSLAAEVRSDLYSYSICVNDKLWPKQYACVWKPVFHPNKETVVAPVRVKNKWGMAEDGEIIWDSNFIQVWEQQYSNDGRKLAAIVSPSYGKWTVAIDCNLWRNKFNEIVSSLVIGHEGEKVAVAAKHNGIWRVVVDDNVWKHKTDAIWTPIFSKNSKNLAVKIRKGKIFSYIVNNHFYEHKFDNTWDPVFSNSGKKIMLRTYKNGIYKRTILMINNNFPRRKNV